MQTVMVVSGLQSGSFATARVVWPGDPNGPRSQLAASGDLLAFAPSYASVISIVDAKDMTDVYVRQSIRTSGPVSDLTSTGMGAFLAALGSGGQRLIGPAWPA
jgi:hypothetical protein